MRLKIALTMFVLALLACSVPGAGQVEDIANDAATQAAEQLDEQTEQQTGEEGDPVITQTPSPTPEPTATPQPTAEPFPGASNSCSHPYFPVVEGAQWVYLGAVEGDEPDEYVVTHRNVTEDSFEFVQTFEGSEFNATWRCTGDGLVQEVYGSASVAGGGLEFDLETTSVEGITFPENFEPGVTWQTVYEAQADVTGIDGTTSFVITIDYTYVTDEEVTVPAGTFTAARVESTLNIVSPELGADVTVDSVDWYAEGIGRVDNEVVGFGLTSDYELASYQFPE